MRFLFSSPEGSPGKAIVLPLALALVLPKCLSFYVKVFYVMGKALQASCPVPVTGLVFFP